MEQITATNTRPIDLQGSVTRRGWRAFASSTVCKLKDHLTRGYDLIVGNDPKLGARPKWDDHDCVRLNLLNDRRDGWPLRTVWAVRPKTNPVLFRVITAGRAGSSMATVRATRLSFPLYCVKLYEARPRKADGVYTYRLVDHLSAGHTWFPTSVKRAEAMAENLGLPYHTDCVQGQPLEAEHCPDWIEPEPESDLPPAIWDAVAPGQRYDLFT